MEVKTEKRYEDQACSIAGVEYTSVVYFSETWTLTKTLQKKLDGVFTRMIRRTLGLTWEDKVTNANLYRNSPTLSSELRQRRLRFAGHCWRSKNEISSDLLMWEPLHGKRRRGAPARTYIDVLQEDTGIEKEDLPKLMADTVLWRSYVDGIRGLVSKLCRWW